MLVKYLGFHGKAITKANNAYTHYNTHPYELDKDKQE